jgi:DNA-binding MarR family transcriptional regulator
MRSPQSVLDDDDFERLLAFRDGLRRFLHWSDEQAKAVGLTGTQHQLLLAVRGHGSDPSIREVAEHLLLRHHSVVELVGRAEAAGLLERVGDPDDHRVVRLRLTTSGQERVGALAAAHLEELSRLRVQFETLWDDLPAATPTSGIGQ